MVLRIFFTVIFSTLLCYAQSVEITIPGATNKALAIHSLTGEKTAFIDSIPAVTAGVYRFTPDKQKFTPGMYRVYTDGRNFITVILDAETVQIETKVNALQDSLQIKQSESNKLFYEFVKLQKDFKLKQDLLLLIAYRYPKGDDYYNATLQKLEAIKHEYTAFVQSVKTQLPHSFIYRYIKTMQSVFTDGMLPQEQQLTFFKEHALAFVDFTNAELTRSDAFTNKSIEYLMYYRNPQLPKELLEQEFTRAVDTLLVKARVNPIVYQHIASYLIDGFKQFGFDKIIDYIVENYVIKDEICLGDKTEAMLKNRLDQAKYFKKGAKVPAITYANSGASQNNLLNSNAEKTLIIFYATWCPHCKEMLPKIYSFYKQQKPGSLAVVAVSLDTKVEDWQAFTEKTCPDWLNFCDLKGWDGKAAHDYFIYATPSMFLIDKNSQLIAKPTNVDEISSSL